MRESKGVLYDCGIEGEVFQHGLELGLVGFVIIGDQFHPLEHHVPVENDGLPFPVVLLPDVQEGLDPYGLDVRPLVHPVDVADDAVEAGIVGGTEDHLPFDLAPGSGIVGLAHGGVRFHLETGDLLDPHFEFPSHLLYLVELEPHVDLGQLAVGFFVEVAQLHPLVHQDLGAGLVVLLVLLDLGEVVFLPGVVHLGPVGDLQAHAEVVDAGDDVGEVEVGAAGEAEPPESIEDLGDTLKHSGVAHHDGLQKIDLYEVDQKEEEERELEGHPDDVPPSGQEGPGLPHPDEFQQLQEGEDAHLRVEHGVEERERDHHNELLIVRQNMEVVGSQPVPRTPWLINLHHSNRTSYYSYLTFFRKQPQRTTQQSQRRLPISASGQRIMSWQMQSSQRTKQTLKMTQMMAEMMRSEEEGQKQMNYTIEAIVMYMSDIQWILCTEEQMLAAYSAYQRFYLQKCARRTAAQQSPIRNMGMQTSQMKKLVWPVRWKRQYMLSVEKRSLSYSLISCAFLILSSTVGETNLFVLSEICQQGGASKKTNTAQILTPSQRFCDWIWLESMEQEVICAPLKRRLNTPDFLISWTQGRVSTLLVLVDSLEREVMMPSSREEKGGPLMRNQVSCADFWQLVVLKGIREVEQSMGVGWLSVVTVKVALQRKIQVLGARVIRQEEVLKLVQVTVNISKVYWMFSEVTVIFWKPVCEKMLQSRSWLKTMSMQIISLTTLAKYMLIVRSTHTESQSRQSPVPVALLAIVPFGQESRQVPERRQKPGMHWVQGVGLPVQREQLELQARQMLGPVPLKVSPQQALGQTRMHYPLRLVVLQRQALNCPERVQMVQMLQAPSQTLQKGLHLVQLVPLGSRKYWVGQGLQHIHPVQQVEPAMQLVQQVALLMQVAQEELQRSQVREVLLPKQPSGQGLMQVGQFGLTVVLRKDAQMPEVVQAVQLSRTVLQAVQRRSQQTQKLGAEQPKRLRQVTSQVLLLCQQVTVALEKQRQHWVFKAPQHSAQQGWQVWMRMRNSRTPHLADELVVSLQVMSHCRGVLVMLQTGQRRESLIQYSLYLLEEVYWHRLLEVNLPLRVLTKGLVATVSVP